jgi:hypothetical protein
VVAVLIALGWLSASVRAPTIDAVARLGGVAERRAAQKSGEDPSFAYFRLARRPIVDPVQLGQRS